MSRIIRRSIMVSLVLVAMTAFASVALAGTCNVDGITVRTSVFTGVPTIPCQVGNNVIKEVITVKGLGGPQTFTELRCGNFDDGITFVVNGFTHWIGPKGDDWQGVTNGNCRALKHRAR